MSNNDRQQYQSEFATYTTQEAEVLNNTHRYKTMNYTKDIEHLKKLNYILQSRLEYKLKDIENHYTIGGYTKQDLKEYALLLIRLTKEVKQ